MKAIRTVYDARVEKCYGDAVKILRGSARLERAERQQAMDREHLETVLKQQPRIGLLGHGKKQKVYITTKGGRTVIRTPQNIGDLIAIINEENAEEVLS